MDKVELRVVRQADGEVDRLWAAVFGVAGGTIGRGGQNKLVLPDTDAGVARVHAMVRMESEAAYIANLCERRSIFVAGEEVRSGEEVKLAVGDEVRIGPYTLYSVVPGAPFVAPVPAPAPALSPVAVPADAPAAASARTSVPVADPAHAAAAVALPQAVPAVADTPEEDVAPAAYVPPPAALFEAPPASPAHPAAGRPLQSPVETFPAAEDDDNPFAMLGRVESPASPAPVRAPQPAVAPVASALVASGPDAMPVPTTGLSLLSGVPSAGSPEPALPAFAPAEAVPPAVPSAAPAAAGALPVDLGTGGPGTPVRAASPWSVPADPDAPGALGALDAPGAPVPATAKPAAGPRALVIPEDFDLFAADPRRGEEKKDVWGGGLQGKSLSEIANLRHDELLQSLPVSGTKFAHDMDNPSHAGLPKGLDPRSELDPLRLFGGASGPALHDPERGAVALGSDLSQSFSLPKGVPMPEGAQEASAAKPPEGHAPLPPLPMPDPIPQPAAVGGLGAGLSLASHPPSGTQLPAAGASMAGAASAVASPAAPLEGLLRVEGLDLGAFGSEAASADRLDWPMVDTAPGADAAGHARTAEGDWPAAPTLPAAALPGSGQGAASAHPGAQALPIGGLGLEGSGMLSGGSGLAGGWPSASTPPVPPTPTPTSAPARAAPPVDAPAPAPAPVPPPAATTATAASAQEWPGQSATAARSPLAPMLPELEAASPAELQSLIAAFLEGAGVLSKKVEPQRLSPEFMRSFGEAFRVAVQGTIDLLAARSEIKREFRAGVTVISSGANNPLKFLPTSEGVVMQMIGQNFPGFMKPIPAMEEAYDDLRVHQVALMAGLRAAYAEALERFDPAVLEQRTDVTGGVFGMLSATSRKAALWDEYKRSFAEIRRGAEDDLAAFSGQAFLEAYENAEAAAKART
jgi:FHA domain-containing protein